MPNKKPEPKPIVIEPSKFGWRIKDKYYQQYSKAVQLFILQSKSLTPTRLKELESTLNLYNESLEAFQSSNQLLCTKVPSTTQYKLIREAGSDLHSADCNRLLMLLFEDRLRHQAISGTSVPNAIKAILSGYTIPKGAPVGKNKPNE